mgnify:CR=1 FL=1
MINTILKMFLIFVILILFACSSNKLKYIGDSNQVRLNDFKITPDECLKIVKIYRKNYLKVIKITVDGYYKDDQNYYVVDSFFGSTAYGAMKNGIKVNGYTGEVYDRGTQKWLPNPLN